jgi:hypothetical protein
VKRSGNISSYTSERKVALFKVLLCGVLFTVSVLESQKLVFRPTMGGPFPIRSSFDKGALCACYLLFTLALNLLFILSIDISQALSVDIRHKAHPCWCMPTTALFVIAGRRNTILALDLIRK